MKKMKRALAIIGFSFLGLLVGACTGSPIFAVIGLVIGCGLSFFWPVINPKKFRKEIKNQAEQISELETENRKQIEKIKTQKRQLEIQKEKLNSKMTILQMKPEELNNLIKQKEDQLEAIKKANTNEQEKHDKLLSDFETKENNEKNKIETLQQKIEELNKEFKIRNDYKQLQSEINKLNDKILDRKNKVEELRSKIISYDEQINIESYGLYTPHYSFENSIDYKEKLEQVRNKQKKAIKDGTSGIIFNSLTMNGSASEGHKIQQKNIKQLVRTFNVECEAAINKATYTNMPRIEKRINRSFDQLNKLNIENGVELTFSYLSLKLDELHLVFEYERKKEEEKEKLREEREREREEKKVQAELAKQRKAVEKERAKQAKHFELAQSLLKEKMANVNENDEKYKSLQDEVKKLKAKLNELDKRSESLDYRENHSTAGYVYIISNIGAFGQNVFKIGVTRRLDPLERIKELSSASVPFSFDVHALIFSDDAYKLETNLHNYFDKQRVNKVNNRKEFFNITIGQVKDALDKYYNRTFEFHEIPEAEEYRKSLEISEANKMETLAVSN